MPFWCGGRFANKNTCTHASNPCVVSKDNNCLLSRKVSFKVFNTIAKEVVLVKNGAAPTNLVLRRNIEKQLGLTMLRHTNNPTCCWDLIPGDKEPGLDNSKYMLPAEPLELKTSLHLQFSHSMRGDVRSKFILRQEPDRG